MSTRDPARVIVEFLAFSARLKSELRHSWLADGRRESVAEHTWQMALFALLAHPHLEHPVDLCRTLTLCLIHDLAEAETGDVPFFADDQRRRDKTARERAAMERVRERLGEPVGSEVFDLFVEYEAAATIEARFARALDNLEVQIQHNLADLSTWEEPEYALVDSKMDGPCAHDAFLRRLCAVIKADAELKIRGGTERSG